MWWPDRAPPQHERRGSGGRIRSKRLRTGSARQSVLPNNTGERRERVTQGRKAQGIAKACPFHAPWSVLFLQKSSLVHLHAQMRCCVRSFCARLPLRATWSHVQHAVADCPMSMADSSPSPAQSFPPRVCTPPPHTRPVARLLARRRRRRYSRRQM